VSLEYGSSGFVNPLTRKINKNFVTGHTLADKYIWNIDWYSVQPYFAGFTHSGTIDLTFKAINTNFVTFDLTHKFPNGTKVWYLNETFFAKESLSHGNISYFDRYLLPQNMDPTALQEWFTAFWTVYGIKGYGSYIPIIKTTYKSVGDYFETSIELNYTA